MTYAIFTYATDAACLAACIRQVRRVDPRAYVAVFDDGSHPLPERPDCDLYRVTTWPRGGNLVGMPCVIGELSAFVESMDAAGDTHIVKIDADTMLLTLDGLQGDGDAIGYESHETPLYAVGPCYKLSRRIVLKIASYIYSRKWGKGRYPEDFTIFRLAMALTEPERWTLYPSPSGLIAGITKGDAAEAAVLATAGLHFIHCGEPEVVGGKRRRRLRKDAADAMEHLERALA